MQEIRGFFLYRLQPAKYVGKLKCYWRLSSTDPYYKLGPVKEEVAHLAPKIWVYHDILSPQEQKDIIKTAGPFVSHAHLLNPTSKEWEVQNV